MRRCGVGLSVADHNVRTIEALIFPLVSFILACPLTQYTIILRDWVARCNSSTSAAPLDHSGAPAWSLYLVFHALARLITASTQREGERKAQNGAETGAISHVMSDPEISVIF